MRAAPEGICALCHDVYQEYTECELFVECEGHSFLLFREMGAIVKVGGRKSRRPILVNAWL